MIIGELGWAPRAVSKHAAGRVGRKRKPRKNRRKR